MEDEKITPQKVYVPVSVKDDNPDEGSDVFVITEDYGVYKAVVEYTDDDFIDHNLPEEGTGRPTIISEFVTHFLKETTLYCLTREQILKLLEDARQEMKDSLLKQIAQTFLNPSNQDKAEHRYDAAVFQAVGETIQSFPFQETEYIQQLIT